MKLIKIIPIIYFILGIGYSYLAYDFAGEYLIGVETDILETKMVGGGAALAAEGGAIGFSILSGICFFCTAYLLKKEQPK